MTTMPTWLPTVADAVIQLARFALFAYGIRVGQNVIIAWLDRGPHLLGGRRNAIERAVDAAREAGLPDPLVAREDPMLPDPTDDERHLVYQGVAAN